MQKECVVLNGQVINIGPWDYQYHEVDGEQIAQNPFPDGATIETRDFEYDDVYGWREDGTVIPPTLEERLRIAEQALLNMMEVL